MAENTKREPGARLPARVDAEGGPALTGALSGLADVRVKVTAVLGRTEITFDEAVNLGEKSVLSVDRTSSDAVELCVNGRAVALGKLVVVGDSYGVQITELIDGGKIRA